MTLWWFSANFQGRTTRIDPLLLCFLQETNLSIHTSASLRMMSKEASVSQCVSCDNLSFLTAKECIEHWASLYSFFLDKCIKIYALNCLRWCIYAHVQWMNKCLHVWCACLHLDHWNSSSGQAPGSEVRLMTSTEHPGGKGLNLHAIQIAPDSIPHCY